jgi:uncharacterized membrane protein
MLNKSLLLSGIILLLIDSIYINLSKKYFINQIQRIQNKKPKLNYIGIILCYIFLIIGINYFIIKPSKSISDAFILGIVIYGVYETTNYALLENWSFLTVIMDTLWGGILFALTTYIMIKLQKYLNINK